MTPTNVQQTNIWVVIPAAGIGARMSSDRPKQYLSLLNQPLICHSLRPFLTHSAISRIVVAIHPEDYFWQKLPRDITDAVMTAEGGDTRSESVYRGLLALKAFAGPNDWVLVHDAARPCIQAADIDRLLSHCQNHAVGGLLGLPASDTLKRVNEHNEVIQTLPRQQIWHAQTPQLFRYQILLDAITQAHQAGIAVTDEASAVEYLGLQPLMVPGNAKNIKVTLPSDLRIAEQWLLNQVVECASV